jgi:hypothetical protein
MLFGVGVVGIFFFLNTICITYIDGPSSPVNESRFDSGKVLPDRSKYGRPGGAFRNVPQTAKSGPGRIRFDDKDM